MNFAEAFDVRVNRNWERLLHWFFGLLEARDDRVLVKKCLKGTDDWFIFEEKSNPVPIHKIVMERVEEK